MIPFIPPPGDLPAVSGPARPVESDPEGYPKRSCCQHCDEVIEQKAAGDPWTVGNGYECPQAPNPEEGPMPHHEPGVILHLPKR